jgi:methylenetetrahydrofolate--tRNA-(uracil-5-)-methyltransferase
MTDLRDARPAPEDSPHVVVVGAGLAGCEAAHQATRLGARVTLYEMKPDRFSPAHASPDFAELVCSNSLRADTMANAVGCLKEEMRRLGSLTLEAADATAVPAGRALAVDRQVFSRHITHAIESNPRIEIRRELVADIPGDANVVLATGPLTAPEMARALQKLIGDEYLYFYDAIAPTIYADSIDHEVVFRASRWEEGEGDYLNVPLDAGQYRAFIAALTEAETVPLHAHEAAMYFEGCLPIEEMARRGPQTLSFGPMKPVGLEDPRTGKQAHAVVQLRQEDKAGVLYNLVGFQTKMRVREQQRVFRSLPGLGEAVFARYGSVHRNTYINAPKRLQPSLELKARDGLFIAGQMAGVEGYVESAALGFIAGVNAACRARGVDAPEAPRESAHGALLGHLMEASPRNFQPMNVNYGLFTPLPPEAREGRGKLPKREKNRLLAERAVRAAEDWASAIAGARP